MRKKGQNIAVKCEIFLGKSYRKKAPNIAVHFSYGYVNEKKSPNIPVNCEIFVGICQYEKGQNIAVYCGIFVGKS